MSHQLLPGEEALRTARQHWAVFVPVVLISVLAVIVVAVILKLLPGEVSGRSLHEVKVFIALATVVAATIALGLRYLRWRFTTFLVTNRRVVVSRGVLSRYMESITLDRVQDISVSQSLLGRMFKAGNVEIESAGRADGSAVIKLILDPVGFSNLIQQAVEAHRTGQPFGAAAPQPGAMPPGGYVPPGGSPQGGYAPPPGYGPPPRRDV